MKKLTFNNVIFIFSSQNNNSLFGQGFFFYQLILQNVIIKYLNIKTRRKLMQKKLGSNSNFRIIIKNSHCQTRSSSTDLNNGKFTNTNDVIHEKVLTSQNNNATLTLVPRNRSLSTKKLENSNSQIKNHRFSQITYKKPLIIDQRQRRLSLNNVNFIKTIISTNKKSLKLNYTLNQQLNKTQGNQFNNNTITNSNIQRVSDDKPNFCSNCKLLQQKCNNKKNDYLNQQKHEKIKNQIGIQTQHVEYQKQSYLEFLRFKIGKKQNYQKMQNLFSFFQKLTQVENQNLKNFAEGFHKQNQNLNLQKQRQKRIQQLKEDYFYSYNNLCSQFKNNIIQVNKTKIQDLFNKQLHNNYSKFYKKYISKVKTQLQTNLKNQKSVCHQIQKTFQKMEHDFQQFNNFRNQQLTNIKHQIKILNKNLQHSFNIWQNKVTQYTTIIKNCVSSISKMPQMCSIMFGFGQSKDHDKTNDQIKKFGVDINKIPNISDFFTRKDTQNVEQIDKAFSKCCEIKCMNCVYLRSKMKYVYMKNIQLQPITKALVHLMQNHNEMNKKFESHKMCQFGNIIQNKSNTQ